MPEDDDNLIEFNLTVTLTTKKKKTMISISQFFNIQELSIYLKLLKLYLNV